MSSSQSQKIQNWITKIEKFFRIWSRFNLYQKQKLSRLYQVYEVFVLSIITEAFYQKGYRINLMNPYGGRNVFRVKLSPRGNPQNFSYLSASGQNTYSIANNIGIETQHIIHHIFLPKLVITPDIVILNGDLMSMIPRNYFKSCVSNINLEAFIECKNLNPFPELLATFEGLTFRFHGIQKYICHGSCIYDAMFVSGPATSTIQNYTNVTNSRYCIRIYTDINPGNHSQIRKALKDYASSVP